MTRVIRLLLASMAVLAAGQQPCVDYIAIDEDRRSTRYEVTIDQKILSDFNRIETGKYYRFTSYVGDQIPSGPVENNHCGTVYPIFMLGLHPTPEEGDSSRRVCARDIDTQTCFWNETINVHFCTNGDEAFVVYQLVATPYADMAYCAGGGAPCIDSVWNEFLQACEGADAYPKMTAPVMSDPYITKTEQLPDQTCFSDPLTSVSQFGFDCMVGYTLHPTDNRARFHVTWFADDVILLKLTLNSTHLKTTLTENDLTTHFGRTVFCQVRSYWLRFENQTSSWSDALLSNNYHTGVYPVSNDIVIDERAFPQIHPIKLRSTVPVTCWRCLRIMERCQAPGCVGTCILAKKYCSHPCSVFAPVQSNGVTSTCELRLFEQSGFINVQIQQIPGAVAGRIAFISTEQFVRTMQPSPFDEYKIDSIPIRIKDTELDGMCTLTGDPHVKTFDAVYYDGYQPGDFLLFSASGFIEIQGRFSKCGTVACVCGVAVREFNNVISVDRCHKTFTQIVEHLTDDKPGRAIITTSHEDGREIRMKLTSGVTVKVSKMASEYINVYIYAPSSFKNKSAFGLCGNYDGVGRNDLRIRNSQDIAVGYEPVNFTNSYRIPPPRSYFVVPPTARDNFTVESTMCDCQNGTVVCQDVTNLPGLVPHFGVKNENDVNIRRRRRDASTMNIINTMDDLLLDPADVYSSADSDNGGPVNTVWPTPSGISEVQARTACQDLIEQSNAAGFCQEKASDVVNEVLSGCVTDIQVTDSMDFTSDLATSMERTCVDELTARQNVSVDELVHDNKTDSLVQLQLHNIILQICPNQCSGNGVCKHGTCMCNPGFKGDGCEIDLSQPPSVVDSQGRGVCDVTIRACRQTRLYGANIWSNPDLKCRVSLMKEHAGGKRMVAVWEDSVVYMSSTEVTCNLPESPLHSPSPDDDQNSGSSHHMWWLSLTNDGDLYSQAYPYTLYDSHCQSCRNSTSCFQKPSTCDIHRSCFEHLDQHEDDICRQCRADVSMTSWSYKENSPPVVTTASISPTDGSGRLQLEAMDAEGHNYTFRLVSGKNAAVTTDGILTWEADSSNDGDIEIQVIDLCGATATFNVRRLSAKSNKLAIIVSGAVVVVGILVAAVVGLILLVKHRRRRQDDNAHPDPPREPYESNGQEPYEEINLQEQNPHTYSNLNPKR